MRAVAVAVAKTYRLLKVIFNTAVDNELIRRNPRPIPGGASDSSPERPPLEPARACAT